MTAMFCGGVSSIASVGTALLSLAFNVLRRFSAAFFTLLNAFA